MIARRPVVERAVRSYKVNVYVKIAWTPATAMENGTEYGDKKQVGYSISPGMAIIESSDNTR